MISTDMHHPWSVHALRQSGAVAIVFVTILMTYTSGRIGYFKTFNLIELRSAFWK